MNTVEPLSYLKNFNLEVAPARNISWELVWNDKECYLHSDKGDEPKGLNDTSALIWSLCDGDHTIQEILDNLIALYPDDQESVAADLAEFLEKFRQQDLLWGSFKDRYPFPPTPKREKKKLTIGMATYDDYDGVYFSVQSIRMYHPEVADEIEIIVLDNNPHGNCAEGLKKLDASIENYRYIPYDIKQSTAVRDVLFIEANSEYVLCIDCHVLLEPGSLRKLIDYFEDNPNDKNLLHGPLVDDSLSQVYTHMEPVWNEAMFGVWGVDERGADSDAQPFEIPMHGAGLFACRKDAWLGFNFRFSGFGGEEGYMHEKFRQARRKVLCLPFLRWLHRFDRPTGVPYNINWISRIRNYYCGANELGSDHKGIKNHFSEINEDFGQLCDEAEAEVTNPFYYFDAIYCINLNHQTNRWSEMQERFEKMGIVHRVKRFEAEYTPVNHHIGCALSHRKIIAEAQYHKHNNILVFEDDAIFKNGILEKTGSQYR